MWNFDRSYFLDIIADLGEYHELYSRSKVEMNEYGEVVGKFTKYRIWGSLQPQEHSNANAAGLGNIVEQSFNFYCSWEYRIHLGDLIKSFDNVWLKVDEVMNWDRYGVREIKCTTISFGEVRNLLEIAKFLPEDDKTESDLKDINEILEDKDE